MTPEKKEEILHYGHAVSGTVIEGATIIENLINFLITYYYCNDDNKIDEFIGLIQEVSILKRIDYVAIILSELDKNVKEDNDKFCTRKMNFEYFHDLKKNKDGTTDKIIVTSVIDAMIKYNLLRNCFAHGVLKCLDLKKDGDKITDFNFKIQDFRPLNGSGKKKKEEDIITDRVGSITKSEFIFLSNDVRKIRDVLVKARNIVEKYERLPMKENEK